MKIDMVIKIVFLICALFGVLTLVSSVMWYLRGYVSFAAFKAVLGIILIVLFGRMLFKKTTSSGKAGSEPYAETSALPSRQSRKRRKQQAAS